MPSPTVHHLTSAQKMLLDAITGTLSADPAIGAAWTGQPNSNMPAAPTSSATSV